MKKAGLILFDVLLAIYAPGRSTIFVFGSTIGCSDSNQGSQPIELELDLHHRHVGAEDEATPSPCRVAVTISGDIQSLVPPVVHRSVRQNLIGAIEDDGCQVDVFAYATRGDKVSRPTQAKPSEFTPRAGEVDAALAYLAPTRLVWHQDQAGIIPNGCPEELSRLSYKSFDADSSSYYGKPGAPDFTGSSSTGWWQEDRTEEASRTLYWRLYKSLAAYRMALREEEKGRFVYDWIVCARLDTAWIRRLPPLSTFSRQAVWLGTHHWPISNNFALVPRAFADNFFLAITAFYACDGVSWPPAESWWQPGCHGTGFEESVVFRHLHVAQVPYRLYPLFEYVVLGGDRRSMCDSGRSAYATACTLLELSDYLKPGFSSANCIATLAEWSNLRCQAFFPTEGTRGDGRRAEVIIDSDPSAWEKVIFDAPTENLMPAHVENARSKLRILRDTVVMLSPTTVLDIELGSAFEDNNGERRRTSTNRGRWEGWDSIPPWSIFSPNGCPLAEYHGRAPHLVIHYIAGQRLLRELGLSLKCLAHRLAGWGMVDAKEGANIDETLCLRTRPLEHVMVEISLHSEELGVCTADGSLRLHALEHVKAFFHDPMVHCVGYGKLTSPTSNVTKRVSPEVVEDHVKRAITSEWATTTSSTVVTRAVTTKRSDQHTEEDPAAAAATTTMPIEVEGMGTGEEKNLARGVKALASEAEAMASASHSLTADGSNVSGGDVYHERLAEEGDAWRDGERSTATSLLEPPACLVLSVQEMTVVHPREGAVYWEGPVDVSLVASLAGPGVQGLDPQNVHVCADIEFAWPIDNWSRTCVSLQDLTSPTLPSPTFGSTIGVVTGSVSIWDARPECIPPGSLRGDVLQMTGGDNVQGDVASKLIRFKIIHHASSLERRGRPLGPAPLGRGLATAEGFIAELERETEDEASTAFEEMESYTNGSHGRSVHLMGNQCGSRLDMQSRGSSLSTSGFHIQFVVEQLDWMLANGKLPPAMAVVADRTRELQETLPNVSSPDFYTPRILGEGWRRVAPFSQKFLSIPAPVEERVVSAVPLQTWEYDEIPWMEALNPEVDWLAVEEAYLGNEQVELAYVDNFFSPKALATLLDMARGSTIFVDTRINYIGAYPGDGMSHPLLYQIAEEAAERLPRVVGRGTPGWPLVQSWIYVYGGNDGERCTRGIRAHADTAMVNLNVWLAPDSANLGSPETGDGGGLTVFHARPPDDWTFYEFNQDPQAAVRFLQEFDAGNTSVAHKQNRALLFDSMLFHQSDPFRFKKGFENRRINLTLLFGPQKKPSPRGQGNVKSSAEMEAVTNNAAMTKALERIPGAWYNRPQAMQEVSPQDARQLRYCI